MTGSATLSRPRAPGGGALDFDALYRASRDDVYAYVATLVRDRSAAEEVTAAAFERAFRKRGAYKPGRGTPRAWLFGIARNAALDELRRRSRVAALADERPDHGAASVEDRTELALRRAAVARAMAQLAPRDRELVALRHLAGLSPSELAKVLGVSESNAGTLLHRAMTKLRKAVDDDA